MFFLAREEKNGTKLVQISEMCKQERMPKKFVELIVLELKKRGLLHSKIGKGGGYMLAKSPDNIYLGDIIRILDGPLAPTTCTSKTAYHKCEECIDESTCEIKRVMKNVRESTASILDGTSLTQAMKKRR